MRDIFRKYAPRETFCCREITHLFEITPPPPPAKEKQTILLILEFFNIWSKVSGIKSGKTTKAEANSFLGFPLFVVGVTTFCNLGDIIINTAVSTVLMFNELLQEII